LKLNSGVGGESGSILLCISLAMITNRKSHMHIWLVWK